MAAGDTFEVDSGRAWIVVFGAFLTAFVVFGASYTFGIFLRPIEEELHVTHAALSTVFSTATVIAFFLSPFTGRVADRYGPRRVVACGAVLLCAGLVGTARARSFPLLFLTYGVGLGSAVGCAYIPAITPTPIAAPHSMQQSPQGWLLLSPSRCISSIHRPLW